MQVRIETVVDEKERLADAFRRRVELLAAEALSERGRFGLALSGGSVAEALLPELAEAELD